MDRATAADLEPGSLTPLTLVCGGGLVASAVAGSESLWAFSSGSVPRTELLWIIGGALLMGFSASTAAILVRSLGRSEDVVRGTLALAPVLAFGLRWPSVRSSLEGSVGVGLRFLVLLLLIIAALVLVRRTAGMTSRFGVGLVLLSHAAVATFAMRAVDFGRMKTSLLGEPQHGILFVILACFLAGSVWRAWRARGVMRERLPLQAVTALVVGSLSAMIVGPTGPFLPERAKRAGPGAPIVLIVLDTVRADALSPYSSAVDTPKLKAFNKEATLYTRAYSNGTYTLTGHGSLFTGMLPSRHGAHPSGVRGGQLPLDTGLETLADKLAARGFATAAIAANYGYLGPFFGLTRGFEAVRTDAPVPNFNPLTRPLRRVLFGSDSLPAVEFWNARSLRIAAERWLLGSRAPSFMFLNFMEAHTSFREPGDKAVTYRRQPGFPDGSPEMSVPRRDYQTAVEYLDSEVGHLLAELKVNRLWDEALVIITADHGELFGEHGQSGHGPVFPYEGVVRVPLLIKYPGQKEARREDELVTLLDIPGLVLTTIDKGHWTPAERRGPTLVAEGWGAPSGAISLPTAGIPFSRAIYVGHHKYMERWDGKDLMFDLESDPDEENNLFLSKPTLAEGLRNLIHQTIPSPRSQAGTSPKPSASIPAETLELLRSLGYVR